MPLRTGRGENGSEGAYGGLDLSEAAVLHGLQDLKAFVLLLEHQTVLGAGVRGAQSCQVAASPAPGQPRRWPCRCSGGG